MLTGCHPTDGSPLGRKSRRVLPGTSKGYASDSSANFDEYLCELAEKDSDDLTAGGGHLHNNCAGSQEYQTASECASNAVAGANNYPRKKRGGITKETEKPYSIPGGALCNDDDDDDDYSTCDDASQELKTQAKKRVNVVSPATSATTSKKPRKASGPHGGSPGAGNRTVEAVDAQAFGILLKNVKKLQVWCFVTELSFVSLPSWLSCWWFLFNSFNLQLPISEFQKGNQTTIIKLNEIASLQERVHQN